MSSLSALSSTVFFVIIFLIERRLAMKFDYKTYMEQFLDRDLYLKYYQRKEEVFTKLDNASMNGWMKPDVSCVAHILEVRDEVVNHSSCLVVVGIGGSFLGSCAFYSMFTPYFQESNFPIIYAGTTLSSNYMSELLEYLEDVDFSVNVISKSGTTMETSITYLAIKKLMEKKYSKEEMKSRIIITTDARDGNLRKEVEEEGYPSFVIPDNIGGRYSLLTPAHLFPLSFVLDINELISGYFKGLEFREDAFLYAVIRRTMFDQGKVVENFVTYEEDMANYMEWLKQLFGETEGKEGRGILPISMVHTRDLHSLGQFVQEGNKILFETFFKVLSSSSCVTSLGDFKDINLLVEDAVIHAHVKGGVPCIAIELEEKSPKVLGEVSSFFFLVAAYSGYLFDINPFDQPGVEVYKSEVRERL